MRTLLTSRPLRTAALFLALGAASLGAGCTATTYDLNAEELARFEAAGPITPEFDEERLLESIQPPGVYTVIPGDLLKVRVPPSMATSVAEGLPQTSVEHYARVASAGSIEVPLAGTIEVSGLTVQEIEASIADRVFPELLSQRPSIVVTVEEPNTISVTVYGAVGTAGVHDLRSDQMTGQLILGARRIVVYSPGDTGTPSIQALPVRGLNVPFYDMPLQGGERIEVERYEPDRFTVVGLVKNAGALEYPPETAYNLMQAIAMAGGVDPIADPPYATVFRKDLETGQILPATFPIKGNGLVQSSALEIKPGDVIYIGHSAASWTRAFAAEVFRINIGFFIDPNRV